jgi:uncharacterized protein (TIGR03083 family)
VTSRRAADHNGGVTDAEIYGEARTALIALARDHVDELDQPAPATPGWRVRDVLSHVGGVCDDILHGNLEGVATDAWTAAQVDKRRSWPASEILDDWERNGDAMDALLASLPSGRSGQLLFDTWTHEQDVRGALGLPGGRDTTLCARTWEWTTGVMDDRDRGEERTALTLVADGVTRDVGVGLAETVVQMPRFELLRAMSGRRSVAQVLGWQWDGSADPDRILLAPFFHPASDDLQE